MELLFDKIWFTCLAGLLLFGFLALVSLDYNRKVSEILMKISIGFLVVSMLTTIASIWVI